MSNLKDGGHVFLKCSACRKRLCDIWIQRPDIDLVLNYRATCPFCGDKSALQEIKGGVAFGGISEANPDNEYDDYRFYTMVDRPEWDGETVELIVKKAKP